MSTYERRKTTLETASQLRHGLTDPQRRALEELEEFGWELGFVRRNPFKAPVMFVFDQASDRYAVVEPDGSLGDNAGYNIRH